MVIRGAEAHERGALGELLGLLLDAHGPGPRFEAAVPGNRAGGLAQLLEAHLDHPDGRVFVAAHGDQLLGFVSVAIARRAPPFAERARGQIEHLVVRPEARRQGLGRDLALRALDWLREAGVSRVELEVATDNPAGRGFWAALGFEAVAEVLERTL